MTPMIYRYLPSFVVAVHYPKRSSLTDYTVLWALLITPRRTPVLNILKIVILLSACSCRVA